MPDATLLANSALPPGSRALQRSLSDSGAAAAVLHAIREASTGHEPQTV